VAIASKRSEPDNAHFMSIDDEIPRSSRALASRCRVGSGVVSYSDLADQSRGSSGGRKIRTFRAKGGNRLGIRNFGTNVRAVHFRSFSFFLRRFCHDRVETISKGHTRKEQPKEELILGRNLLEHCDFEFCDA
jgi:hypothetical protein